MHDDSKIKHSSQCFHWQQGKRLWWGHLFYSSLQSPLPIVLLKTTGQNAKGEQSTAVINSTCNLHGNSFVNNTAVLYGGAIFGQHYTNFKLNHTQFKFNSAVRTDGESIALIHSNEISVDNCLFEGSSGQEVGAIYSS